VDISYIIKLLLVLGVDLLQNFPQKLINLKLLPRDDVPATEALPELLFRSLVKLQKVNKVKAIQVCTVVTSCRELDNLICDGISNT